VQLKVAVVVLLLTLSGVAENRAPAPVNCRQLLSWIAGGIPGQRLSRLARERGITFALDENTAAILARAGVSSDLIDELQNLGGPGTVGQSAVCPAELARAAEFVHRQNYDQAEPIFRKLLTATPDDADLHLALGYIRLQQDDLDEAFDGYADAKDLNPEFPEIHNGLSFVFYRSNDAENAIAEARTALSIDPQNAEGYRYLGLALYADENYTAALHAFHESLARDPNRAETYYDTGLAQDAEKNLAAAAESYQKAIRLDPELLEARTRLGAVLHQLGQPQAAVTDGQKLQPESSSPR
jgi:cytochrome c-type biogenesis protein CcmH/NrfG